MNVLGVIGVGQLCRCRRRLTGENSRTRNVVMAVTYSVVGRTHTRILIPRFRRMTVRRRAVVFDDDRLIRYALWKQFDERGYEVFTFPHPGLCHLDVAQECPCPLNTSCADLIISDVNMHATNGIDFLERLVRKGCKQRHFALMSGDFSEADLARASQLGCTSLPSHST